MNFKVSKGPMAKGSMEGQISLRNLSKMLGRTLWDVVVVAVVCVCVTLCL